MGFKTPLVSLSNSLSLHHLVKYFLSDDLTFLKDNLDNIFYKKER